MLRKIFHRYVKVTEKPITDAPIQIAYAPIMSIWHIERGTLQHRLAQESLILVQHKETPRDHDTFTDNGDLTLSVYYNDLLKAYSKEIRKQELKRNRVLD